MPRAIKPNCGGPLTCSASLRWTFSRSRCASILFFAVLVGTLVLAAASRAQNAETPSQDPDTFVHQVLQHECDAELGDHALWTFRQAKKEDGKTKIYRVYQTKQGDITLLTTVDGQPLSPKQAESEDARINKLINHPAEMRSEQRKQAEDGERARNLLKTLPEAFHFQYDGKEGSLIRLKFTPNPKSHASGHAVQVFHHMEGTILLDAEHQRLIAIHGQLTSEVKFGYGMFGHLAPGGTFEVIQQEVTPGYWEVTRMHVEMHGKALFFKTIGAHEDETYSDFKRVPENVSLQQAAAQVRHGATGD